MSRYGPAEVNPSGLMVTSGSGGSAWGGNSNEIIEPVVTAVTPLTGAEIISSRPPVRRYATNTGATTWDFLGSGKGLPIVKRFSCVSVLCPLGFTITVNSGMPDVQGCFISIPNSVEFIFVFLLENNAIYYEL